jgi:hypothetical protein
MGVRKIIAILILAVVGLRAANLGDYFYAEEHYFEAVTEYKRQLCFKTYDSRDEILYKIARASYAAGQRELTLDYLIEIVTNAERSTADYQSTILLARLYWDTYDYPAMRRVLEFYRGFLADDYQKRLEYVKAWTYIYQADWHNATAVLQVLDSLQYISLIQEIQGAEKVPQKSRTLALISSLIIPGSGQLYAGDYKNALYAFLLVGSITASIVYDVISEAYFIAIVKYLFLYTRYGRGALAHMSKQIDRENIDRIGNYLKEVSSRYPKPLDILESTMPTGPLSGEAFLEP